MDPDAAPEQAREALRDLREAVSAEEALDAAEQLAERFEALDGWLSKEGFLPMDWLEAGR